MKRRDRESSERRVVWQAVSLLLAYPDDGMSHRLDVIETAASTLPESYRRQLLSCSGYLRGLPVLQAAAEYAETFDWRRRRTLFLTYYTAGDTRNRGLALLAFADVYRAAGTSPPQHELPDHLAVVLEFAATVDHRTGYELLCRHRTPIDMLHAGLAKARSPYANAIAAVSMTLPPATDADLRQARKLAMQGPPTESVGLEPFALTIGTRGGTR